MILDSNTHRIREIRVKIARSSSRELKAPAPGFVSPASAPRELKSNFEDT